MYSVILIRGLVPQRFVGTIKGHLGTAPNKKKTPDSYAGFLFKYFKVRAENSLVLVKVIILNILYRTISASNNTLFQCFFMFYRFSLVVYLI